MSTYILKKFVEMLVTLLLICLIVFIMFELIPGNPARIMLGMQADQAQVEALEEELGLGQPLAVKIYNYFKGLAKGDLGYSFRFSAPVKDLLLEALPNTLKLAGYAFALIFALAVPLALLSAAKAGSRLDQVIRFGVELGLAIPPFFMAIILMLLFRTSQIALAAGNGTSNSDWARFFLPALAIALSRTAMAMEFLRDGLVGQLRAAYVKTALGKGASPSRILFGHILRNGLLSFVTALGLVLAEVFSGSVIIEQVFLIPGLGRLLVTAVEARDLSLTQAIILLIGSTVVLVNFLVDLINQYIDPRIRLETRPLLHFGLFKGGGLNAGHK